MGKELLKVVKFVDNGAKDGRDFADRLLDGEIFMRSASHYVHQEYVEQQKGQGDICEGVAMDIVRCCMNRPIFCLYTVWSESLTSDSQYTVISPRIIKEFCKGESGYAVVIDYKKFVELVKLSPFTEYGFSAQPVLYRRPDYKESSSIFTSSHMENILFFKCPFFSYQNEYRIVSFHPLSFANSGQYKLFGDPQTKALWSKEYDTFTEHIGSIREFSHKVSIASLKKDISGNYLLPLSK